MSLCSVKNSTQTAASAGYGGTVVPVVDVIVHYNQGIGNGAEGGDPGKSRPHGCSNDELGRTPGSSCGKKSADKPAATEDHDLLAAAGYGGTVTSAGYGGTVTPVVDVIVHCNQGIGNGAEGRDPGKSRPRGSSNDEWGRTPRSGCGKRSNDRLTGTESDDVLASVGGGETADSAGYGGTVDPVTPVVDVIVHYNQGIGNGSEGGDPGKSRPHGCSNDELERTPGSNFGKNSNDKLTGTKRNDTLVGGCGSQGYSTGKACDNKTLGSDPITNFSGTNKSGLGKTAFGTSKNCVDEGFSKISGLTGTVKGAEFGRPCTPIVGGIEPKGMFYNQNSCGVGLGAGAKSAILPHMACGTTFSSSNFVIHA